MTGAAPENVRQRMIDQRVREAGHSEVMTGSCGHPGDRPSEGEIYHLVHRLFWSMNAAIQYRARLHGLHPAQWSTLRQLWHRDGISQHVLGRRLGYRDSTLTSVLGKMETRALVHRRINPLNRREKLVFLTERAKAMKPALSPIASDMNEAIGADFSPDEFATLQALLSRANTNLCTTYGLSR